MTGLARGAVAARRALLMSMLVLTGCDEARTIPHDAWVWRRVWTPFLSQAVAEAPIELQRLRVLAAEHEHQAQAAGGRRLVVVDVDTQAMVAAARPVIATWRITGTAPLDGLRIDDVVTVARRWRAAGVDVVGVEIDHDCATSRLEEYARWLTTTKAALQASEPGWQLGITALPTWREAPLLLVRVAGAVDEVTVQLHAVAAPTLFNADTAVDVAAAFARAAGRDVTVALPTYAARVAGGPVLRVEADDVARVLAGLRDVEDVSRVAFFRLGGADEDVFGPATLATLVQRGALMADVVVVTQPAGHGVVDVLVENRGTASGVVPSRVALSELVGAVGFAEGAPGVRVDGDAFAIEAGDVLKAGGRRRLGWVRPRPGEQQPWVRP